MNSRLLSISRPAVLLSAFFLLAGCVATEQSRTLDVPKVATYNQPYAGPRSPISAAPT